MQLLPRQSLCGHCNRPPTQHWLQLVGLIIVILTIVPTSIVSLYLLPRFLVGSQPPGWIQGWLWFQEQLAWYGWVAVAIGLLVWSYWPRYGYEPEWEVRVARGLLLFLLVVLTFGLLGFWVPSPRGSTKVFENLSAIAVGLGWTVVVFVLGVLNWNGETRGRLLGDGRVLSLVALGLLSFSTIFILVGWWLA